MSHILGQKPLRVGPRQCPRQCVEGGVILYVVRVVQILALGGGVNTCFAYIYVGFERRKGLVRNQADLHCSVTCCRLFCSKEKASPLAPLAGYEPDVPFCAVHDQCGEFSISLPKASCQNTATDIQKRNAVHTSFHRAHDLSRGKCPATHLEKEQSLATHTGPDTDPCRPPSRIGLH